MKRCSELAYSTCPDRFFCGNRSDAVFMEGSECDKFNEEQDAIAFRISKVASSCAEHAANALQGCIKEVLDEIERRLEELNAED